MSSTNEWIISGLVMAPITFLAVIVLLWHLEFFDFTGSDASVKIVGTALTLGSGWFGNLKIIDLLFWVDYSHND